MSKRDSIKKGVRGTEEIIMVETKREVNNARKTTEEMNRRADKIETSKMKGYIWGNTEMRERAMMVLTGANPPTKAISMSQMKVINMGQMKVIPNPKAHQL